MEQELNLRIVLETPPPDVDFGLQKGRGNDYETINKQRSNGKDLYFDFTIGVKAGSRDSQPVLLGPFAQGPPAGRFVYIDIGTSAGQADSCWTRRLKIPLSGITREMIERASADPKSIIETRVPGTGRDGGPNCATVKPFKGWSLGRRE